MLAQHHQYNQHLILDIEILDLPRKHRLIFVIQNPFKYLLLFFYFHCSGKVLM